VPQVQPIPVSPNAIRFGLFEADLSTGELRKRGRRIPLQDQPFRVLALLLLHPGDLVSREEFQRALWPGDTFVEFDEGLNKAIQKLRQALDDSSDNPRFIETLPRKGYRFIAPVDRTAGGADAGKGQPTPVDGHASASDSVIITGLIKRHKKAAIGSGGVLAALFALAWFLLHRAPEPSAKLSVTQKRLTFDSSGNPVGSATISPDGKYLAYSDPAGIHIKLLSTSEERLIPRPAGVPAGAYWQVASWFPDGTQLLANAVVMGGSKSMWTVSVLGQSPRELREGARGFGVSPDGTHIAFSQLGPADDPREIWVMGIRGDNMQKVLAAGENERLNSVNWSPDGQRLAYIRVQRSAERYQTSIETCDLKGASRTVVVSADLVLEGFGWLPDGRIVYARRDSLYSGDDNLWQIEIDNHAGTRAGQPKRVTQWAGSYLRGLSASADGRRLALRKETTKGQVYVGELAAGGTRMKPPRRLTNDEASDVPTAWTADSKAVLFDSNRNGTWGIFKQGINQETSEPMVTEPQDVVDFGLSADGAWILFAEIPQMRNQAHPAPRARVMRIPANGGVPQFVLETWNWIGIWCARSPATRCVILETSQERQQLIITAFDPLKGRGKMLRTTENDPSHTYYHAALSPDGSTLAISRSGDAEIRIRLLSPSGSSDREIKVKGWPNIAGLDWSPDGKGLYCGSVSPQVNTLLYIDLKGNARVLWQNKGGSGYIWGVPSPDGRYLAILGAVTNSNVWLVEGF
jgi:DNA-binding winged helix-turn-helix (wHTH) protein/Tol biopolymer transport system component